MQTSLCASLLLSAILVSTVQSFAPLFAAPTQAQARTTLLTMTTASGSTMKSTLTEETTWKLRFVLRNVATAKGKKVDEIFVISGQFIELEGYEPPQGTFRQENVTPTSGDVNNITTTSRLKIVKSRWLLSEDPNDRKDGLWVWGLFKEPLYPFMLLELETDAIALSGGVDDNIPPLQLYAQINHKRENGSAILQATDLKIRQMERIKADPFGVAQVDIYEEVSIGILSIQVAASS